MKRGVDLRSRAGHQHDPHPERMQQRHVVEQRPQIFRGDRFAAENDHERTPAMRVNVGRARSEMLDEWVDLGAHVVSVQ